MLTKTDMTPEQELIKLFEDYQKQLKHIKFEGLDPKEIEHLISGSLR